MGGRQSSSNADPVTSSVSSPQRKSARPTHEFLSEEELTAAKSTWVRLQATRNMQAMGVKIFLRIFELEPATKQAFESFRNLRSEELVTNVLFRSHATRFMKAVEVTMNNLDALDVIIVPNLKHLGRLHTDFKGFHVEYLKAFEVAMDEVWAEELGTAFSGDCRLAWTKIFSLITTKVMEGYNEAKAETATPTKSSSVKAGGSGGSGNRSPLPLPANGNEARQTTNGGHLGSSAHDNKNN